MRPSTTRLKRYKAPVACVPCRRRKLKCDAARPACSRCQKVNNSKDPCTYVGRDANGHSTSAISSETPSLQEGLLNRSQTLSTRENEDVPCAVLRTTAQDYVGSIDFIDRVTAAIDAKTGKPAGRWRYSLIMVDAPLFQCSLNTYVRGTSPSNSCDLLPPRRQADRLTEIYWNHHEPLLPLLDRDRFTERYEALFSGVVLNHNEAVFKATLNVMFALSTQLQESLPSQERSSASDGFFQRAWSLLHPDILIWSPPSLEIVQCLVLMGLYLQCTEHVNQTWAVTGLAVRMGQNIGLNAPYVDTSIISLHDEWYRRLTWERCAYLERNVCWSLGRGYSMPSMPAITLTSMLQRHPNAQRFLGGVPVDCYIKNCEIDQLTLELMMSHIKISAAPKARQNLTEVDMNTLFHFDQRLTDFEKGLPGELQSVKTQAEPEVRRQRSLLHLRLTHDRVLLYRPLLTRFCFAQHRHDDNSASLERDFREQTLKTGAMRCLATAQTLTDLACECRELEDPTCGLPWWYYVFYYFIAAQHIVAAVVRSELTSESASNSFRKALSAAQAYGHLSSCIGDIINVLDRMWQTVMGAHQATVQGGFEIDETWNHSFDEFLKQLGVEGEYPIFDPDWPNIIYP